MEIHDQLQVWLKIRTCVLICRYLSSVEWSFHCFYYFNWKCHPCSSNGAGTAAHNQQTRKIKKPLIGSKVQSQGSGGLKASTIPKQIHLCVGYLDVERATEQVGEFVRQVELAITLHHNELIRSSRFSNPRSISAHIAVSGIDREKVLSANLWPAEISIRSWWFSKHNNCNIWSSVIWQIF